MHLPFSIDLGRGALALLISLAVYFFALSESNPETTRRTEFTVPVEVVNRPAGLVLTNPPPPVQLRVRAAVDVFNRLRPESFVAQADASNATAGEAELFVVARALDADVREVIPDPARVRVRLEEIQERTVPVRVNVTGQVPAGYQMGTPRSEPPRVTVAGPSSQVRNAQEAVADINVERTTVSVNGAFTPRVVDARGNELRELTIRPQSITVGVPITQQAQFKEVGVRPNIVGRPAAGYLLEPVEVTPATVTLVGETAVLEAASFVETEPIDISGLNTSIVRRAGLVPPANTLLLQTGQTVSITLRASPLNISQTLRVPLTVINIPRGLVLARQPEPVDVVISGPAPTLSNLTARDFRVNVSVAGLGAGSHQVAAQVENLPQGMTLERIMPQTPAVELRPAPVTPTPLPTPAPSPTAATPLSPTTTAP